MSKKEQKIDSPTTNDSLTPDPMMDRPSPAGQSYELFRPSVVTDKIALYMDKYKEPGYVYKGVIMNYKHIPRNVLDHEKAGYEIVYSTHQFSDNRGFAPDVEKKDSSVPGPVIKNTADGYQYLLMRITEERFQQNKVKEAKDYHEKYMKSVKRTERKTGSLHADGGFINNNSGDE